MAQTCFYHLCRICAVRRQLGRYITARLVTALVLSHLDYCNAVQWHALLWISSRVTVWLQLFESFTGCQSLRGSSTSCACWVTSRFWDTRRNISQTFWHRLPIVQVDLYCVLHHVATSCCGHVDELAIEPFLLLPRAWNDGRTCFVVIWKHFCFILSTGTKIQIDSVMRPRSSSRERNTSASVTVTVGRASFQSVLLESDG